MFWIHSYGGSARPGTALFRREGLRWPYEQVHRHREILTASESEETGAKATAVGSPAGCLHLCREEKIPDEPRKVINITRTSFYVGQITACPASFRSGQDDAVPDMLLGSRSTQGP